MAYKLYFASMTGNTEEIADIVADKLRECVQMSMLMSVQQLMLSDFLEADIAIAATYTMEMENCHLK